MKSTLRSVISDNNFAKSSSELIEALGKGIGATAAHELGHQALLETPAHVQAQGFYDTKELDETSVDHFFGNLVWSPQAFEKMRKVLRSIQ